MTQARKKVIDDIKNERGLSNKSDERWYWKLRHISEMTFYWINAFNPVVSLFIGIITHDYWKGLAFLFVCQIYNVGQNLRGLFIHIEQMIEWEINKTI